MVPRTYHAENRRICNGRKCHKGAGGIGLVFSRRQRLWRQSLPDLARTAKTVAGPLYRPLRDSLRGGRSLPGCCCTIVYRLWESREPRKRMAFCMTLRGSNFIVSSAGEQAISPTCSLPTPRATELLTSAIRFHVPVVGSLFATMLSSP